MLVILSDGKIIDPWKVAKIRKVDSEHTPKIKSKFSMSGSVYRSTIETEALMNEINSLRIEVLENVGDSLKKMIQNIIEEI